MAAESEASTEVQQQKPEEEQQAKNNFVGSSTGQPLTSQEDVSGTKVEGKEGDAPKEGEEGPKVLGHGGKEMSEEAISERVTRAIKKKFRELTGKEATEEEVKELIQKGMKAPNLSEDDVKEYQRLKRLEEARKRSRMTQEQRVKAEMEQKEKRIRELEEAIAKKEEDEVVRSQDEVVTTAASEYVDPEFMKYAKRDFAEFARKLQEEKPEQFAKFGQTQLKRWFENYVKEKPAFAKKKEEAQQQQQQTNTNTKVVKKPVTTTKTGARPPGEASTAEGPGTWKGKTVKPGQPNSMTRSELREYAKAHGLKLGY